MSPRLSQLNIYPQNQREVEKQNQYEKEWKIKTNMNKFAEGKLMNLS